MDPGRSDRDLLAELEAERASTDHWRRVARQRTDTYDELKHRGIVRGALAAERLTRPLLEAAGARAHRLHGGAERTMLAVAALRGRKALAGRRSRLTAALRDLPAPPSTTDRLISVVAIDATGPAPELAPWDDSVQLVSVARGDGASCGRAVQRAIEAATGDVVVLLRATSVPLDEAWLRRLVSAVRDDVVAATALLVHPERPRRTATPHDLTVREAGLDLAMADDVPVVRARGAGTVPDPTAPPVEVAGASLACLALDRRSLDAAGGFPPVDDLDIAAVELCTRLRERGGRVVALPSVVVLDHRAVSSFRGLHAPIPDDSPGWRAAIDRMGPALVRGLRPNDGVQRLALTVASPSLKVAQRWGDWHLAEGLAQSLRRLGHEVLVQTADRADDPAGRACDVRVVLRGLTPVRRTPGQRHALWIISHPESIEDWELDDADLVLVASPRFAAHLRTRTATPVDVLLQATDHRRFRPLPPDPEHRHTITVVAKTRDVVRPIVVDALAAGLRPRIYGGGWEGLVDPALLVMAHVDNEVLPSVYSSARVVLNDHWSTMRAWGFISNRVFDVLACATPIVSDTVPGLEDLLGDTVATYDGPDDLRAHVEAILGDPAQAARRAERGRQLVLDGHTFDHRARELLDFLRRVSGSGQFE